MKIINRQPEATANISSARDTAGKELLQLIAMAALVVLAGLGGIHFGVEFIVSRISFETEADLFGSAAARFDEEMAAEPIQDAYRESMARTADILEAFRRHPEVPPLPYRLVLMENESPNAFAFPGGTIGVTTGLLEALDADMETAFVIGHEMGHFAHRDHLKGVGRALGSGVLLAILFGGGMENIGQALDLAVQRTYSQSREMAADRYGLRLVHDVYGKTGGVDRLFRLLKETGELPAWAYMLATHPAPEKRIKALAAYADRLAERP